MGDALYDPEEIRRRSREYIEHAVDLDRFDGARRDVVRRVIHATGDPELATTIRFTRDVVAEFRRGIREGLPIVTDVTMVQSGFRRQALEALGIETASYVHDPEAARRAEREGLTRSAAGLDLALEHHGRMLLVVGNAPTALFRLMEHTTASLEERVPAVVGVPVGFVGVREAKRRLLESRFPALVTEGHRGGSPVAAAAVNAMLARERSEQPRG